MAKHNILSTKKLDPSLIEQAKEQGFDITIREAIRINPIFTKEKWHEIQNILDEKKEFAVFTSSNAVSTLRKYLHEYVNPFEVNWKIFSLSGNTKNALEEGPAEFGNIIATADNAVQLAERIVETGVDEVLFFCGDKRRNDLPSMLKEAGIKVTEVVLYQTTETPFTTEQDFDAVLFFSPSAVQSFFSVNQLKENTVCFAIGHTTAEAIRAFIPNEVVVSEYPAQQDMIAELLKHFTVSKEDKEH